MKNFELVIYMERNDKALYKLFNEIDEINVLLYCHHYCNHANPHYHVYVSFKDETHIGYVCGLFGVIPAIGFNCNSANVHLSVRRGRFSEYANYCKDIGCVVTELSRM